MFAGIESSFSRIDEGVHAVERIIHNSRITTEEVQQNLKDWTRDKTGEKLAEKLQLETRAEQLAGGLAQAEALLSTSSSTVQHVDQLLGLGQKAGLPLNTELVDGVSERISTLQTKVVDARQSAENLRLHFGSGDDDGGESREERIEQLGKLAVSLVATFTQLEERAGDFAARTTETRRAIALLNAKTHSRLVSLAVLATLFLLWMAAGQVCLWRQTKPTAASA
jgi:hypothetical protein